MHTTDLAATVLAVHPQGTRNLVGGHAYGHGVVLVEFCTGADRDAFAAAAPDLLEVSASAVTVAGWCGLRVAFRGPEIATAALAHAKSATWAGYWHPRRTAI
jgi:hypothetical protein